MSFPRRRAASKRVSTPAGAGKDIPCRFVNGCPAFGQRTVRVTPLPLPFLSIIYCNRVTGLLIAAEAVETVGNRDAYCRGAVCRRVGSPLGFPCGCA